MRWRPPQEHLRCWEKRCFFYFCVFLFPCHGNYTQGHADVSFNPFHVNNMCCYDSVHYLRQYAAAVMTTKRAQLPVVYHNYRHQSEHLSNHNEWAVLGAGCWSANEHWASPSIMPAINLSQLLTRACNEGVIFHGWSIAHIVTHWPWKIFRWFRRPNGKEIPKQSINNEMDAKKKIIMLEFCRDSTQQLIAPKKGRFITHCIPGSQTRVPAVGQQHNHGELRNSTTWYIIAMKPGGPASSVWVSGPF